MKLVLISFQLIQRITMIVVVLIFLIPLFSKEPSSISQAKVFNEKEIIKPTPELQQANVLSKKNDIKSNEINNDLKSVIPSIDKSNLEKERLRKLNNSLTKEIQHLKQRIVNEKKKFAQYSLSVKNEDKITYLQDSSDYFTPDTIVCRIDTIYIKKKNLFNKIFGNK